MGKKSTKKDILDLIGACEAEDLKPFDFNSKAVEMKDGEMKKSCLTKDDIKKML